jgi:hypothetical protein
MATELKTPELSRHAAVAFVERWKNTTEELQHAQSFWADFFRTLCGIEDEKLAGIEYQKKVKGDVSGNQEYIDVYWKNVALIEHKSAGKNLDKAEIQARGYLRSLPPGYRPKNIIVSDFAVIRIIDVELNRTHEFPLSKLPDNIHRFEAIISGNRTRISQEEITVDQEAARLMANLYLELEDHGFEGHETSIFLVRILFLLFGDDTGMWAKNTFLRLVMGTNEDGSDIGAKFDTLFNTLDTPVEKRPKALEEEFKNFPYVNGGIFAEKISIINFSKKMRVALVDVANYDWTTINPTIFGSLFQLIKDKEARRELGEHYTSEENINKIVYPLFLDKLQERLANAWDNKKELRKLRQDLAKIKIFDPACGCGNFLVVSYRHLRQLELELIARLSILDGTQDSMQLDGSMGLSITLNQLYGIEIEEWPAQVARVALFLTDHQENLKLARVTGETQNRFPITDSASIIQGNALSVDWKTVLRMDGDTYILGNPPFVGMSWLSADQQEDNRRCFADYGKWSSRTGRLDYVACWYAKAIPLIQEFDLQVAFVSTNSITQGDQARVLAPIFLHEGIEISFAHDTFKWISETADGAAVHVVVIGIRSSSNQAKKTLFSISEESGALNVSHPKNINIYLVAGEDILVEKRTRPFLGNLPNCTQGNKPVDGGHLFVDADLVNSDTLDIVAKKYLRKFIGATEFLYNEDRWCLWLVDATPSELKSSRFIMTRLKAVAEARRKSPTQSVREQADTPYLFTQIRQPKVEYLAMPEVSGHTRDYLPVDIFQPDVIVGNKVIFIPDPPTWLFGVISSSMFMLWVKTFAGRHGMSISISPGLTYFIFPFIEPDPEKIKIFERVMSDLVAARREHSQSTLADLYDPATMPKKLKDVHLELDALVDGMYLERKKPSNEQRLEALISAYRKFSKDDQLF